MKSLTLNRVHVRPGLVVPSVTFAMPDGLSKSMHEPAGGRSKRLMDISIALILILVLAPMFVWLALLVTLTSSGGALYGHSRVGYDNRRFKCYKFRTMRADGDVVLSRWLDTHPEARLEWETTQKLAFDPRVTTVGRYLRKLSLDELPQLFNVLKGDMSLVGPRPVVELELQRYGMSARYYVQARPGVTGLWQVSGRSRTSYGRRIAFDRLYVSRTCMKTDIGILLRTIPAVLRSSETS
ncbi:sugar transferase [Wenxinia marina]|nr:sugar transferase [Wenxinia marina]GGL71869.1 exopolysaccharide biosynthesis protein [Wenxinia marina]